MSNVYDYHNNNCKMCKLLAKVERHADFLLVFQPFKCEDLLSISDTRTIRMRNDCLHMRTDIISTSICIVMYFYNI